MPQVKVSPLKKTLSCVVFFFFNDTATTEIYTLSLHDALPIWVGSHPRSAYAAREVESAVPGHGPGDGMERRLGPGMDCPPKRHGPLFLLRRPRARVSRRPDRAAAPLCGPRAVVSAGHDRLLGQRHGRPALLV